MAPRREEHEPAAEEVDVLPCPAEEGHFCEQGSAVDRWHCAHCGRAGGAEDYKRLADELKAKQDGAAPLRYDSARDEAIIAATELELEQASTPQAISVTDLLRLDFPPRRWVVEGLLQDRDIAMLHAWRGVGKTHFISGLAWAVASGSTFLRYRAPNPVGVLIVDGEMPREDLKSRFAAILETAGGRPPEAPLHILAVDMQTEDTLLPSLTTPEGQRIVELKLAELGKGPRLLILDSLSTLCRSILAENDSASWDEMQSWLLRLRRQGITTLFCHHDSKAAAQRGTSKREDVLTQSIQLLRPKDYTPDQGARFEVHLPKARGVFGQAAEGYEAWLRVDEHNRQEWTFRKLGDIRMERARELKDAGVSLRKIEKELGVSKSTVHRWLTTEEEVPAGTSGPQAEGSG